MNYFIYTSHTDMFTMYMSQRMQGRLECDSAIGVTVYYTDTSVLLENTPLKKFI